ncbi:AAA family ATPase [Sinorhizobium meliloti]|uniref:AAA family ATPase n=1 Tax=Rhizobium meliloti TaxID=382 RepID=UPI00398D61FD
MTSSSQPSANQPETDVTNPTRVHIDMLHRLANGLDGVLVVSAFNANLPNDKGTITHHRIGDVDGMLEAVEAHSGTPGANVYIGLQVMRRGLARGQRGKENDIVAVLGLVADMDSDRGLTAGEYPVEPNYCIETSPGNLQPFWLFDRPVLPAIAKTIARGLKSVTGSDHGTADIAHVWRVPGTLNWPTATKLERGRPAEPASVNVSAEWDGTLTDPLSLLAAVGSHSAATTAEPVELGDLPDIDGVEVSAELAALLAANDVGDRSAHAARVVEKLAFDGHQTEVAASLFISAAGDWLGRYNSEERARADFSRMWAKFAKPSTGAAQSFLRNLKAANDNEPPQSAPAKRTAANDNKRPTRAFPGIISSGQFVADFVPPDYLIDGIAQLRFIYSLTGMTGAGKTAVLLLLAYCVATGTEFCGLEVKKGRVVYSAGENPDDVKMRWIAMAEALDFDVNDIDVHFVSGTYSFPESQEKISEDVARIGGAELIIVDTSAAFFDGDDENSNTQLGNHARNMRDLTGVAGGPCVIVATHPVKSATAENMLPRGGGAFLNEVDGNLTLIKSEAGSKLHWQGKHRGADFDALMFSLLKTTAERLVDTRGRQVPTVIAEALSKEDVRSRKQEARNDEDEAILRLEQGAISSTQVAKAAGWQVDGEPHKRRAQTALDKLRKSKLAEYVERKGWKLTKAGEEAASEIRNQRHRERAAADSAARLIQNSRD